MNQSSIGYQGERIVMENEAITVVFEPDDGGRIRSLISKNTGREYLYQDPKRESTGDGYSDNDISGYCECFPTVGPATYPDGMRSGRDMGDHGFLWQSAWDAEITPESLVMSKSVPAFDSFFRRESRLDGNSLRLDYEISNLGNEALKFVYSAHPMLYANESSVLHLPNEMNKAFVYLWRNVPGMADKTWINWPVANEPTLNGPMSGTRDSVIKLFSPKLTDGRAAIYHGDIDESLEFSFNLPYLGILICQGHAGAYPDRKDSVYLGLEPSTAIGDDLPTCALTGTIAELAPGRTTSFRIVISLGRGRLSL